MFVTLPSFTETIATVDEKEDFCPKENTCTVLHTSFADWAVNPGIMLFSEQPNWAAARLLEIDCAFILQFSLHSTMLSGV